VSAKQGDTGTVKVFSKAKYTHSSNKILICLRYVAKSVCELQCEGNISLCV
jgi:hypothetical protein